MVGLYGNAGTIVYASEVANFKKKITFSLKTCIIEKKVVTLHAGLEPEQDIHSASRVK